MLRFSEDYRWIEEGSVLYKFEADTEPLAFGRAVEGRCLCLGPAQSDESLAPEPCHSHLEVTSRNGKKTVGPFAVTTPDFFNER